jgi:tetratricopeptide (TPR) repeat protein
VRRLGHTRTIVANLNFLAMVACAQGKYAEAQTLLHECLADASHDRWNRAIALNQLGLVAHALGNEHEAEHLFQESIRLFREFGDQWGMAQALSHLGVTTIALGDYTQAQRIFHEAYQAAAAGQLLPIALDALMGLATVLVHDGQQAKAVELLVHILNHPACSQEVHHRALALHGELEKQLAPEQVAAIEKQARSRTFDSTVAILLA